MSDGRVVLGGGQSGQRWEYNYGFAEIFPCRMPTKTRNFHSQIPCKTAIHQAVMSVPLVWPFGNEQYEHTALCGEPRFLVTTVKISWHNWKKKLLWSAIAITEWKISIFIQVSAHMQAASCFCSDFSSVVGYFPVFSWSCFRPSDVGMVQPFLTILCRF